MIICLILAITCGMIAGLKYLEGISVSMIAYVIAAVVFLVIYLVNLISNRRDA